MRKLVVLTIVFVLMSSLFVLWRQPSAKAQEPVIGPGDIVTLGKAIFFDPDLSANSTQSCATCHAAEVGFTGPDELVNVGGAVYQGAIPNRYGNRKPPTSAYAGASPELYYDEAAGAWFGGMFWDGRATGWTLHDPLAEHAQGPFLYPLELAIANAQVLCTKLKKASYAGLFEQVWGAGSLDCAKDSDGVYEKIGRSVAAYEESEGVNPYSSKFDLSGTTPRALEKTSPGSNAVLAVWAVVEVAAKQTVTHVPHPTTSTFGASPSKVLSSARGFCSATIIDFLLVSGTATDP